MKGWVVAAALIGAAWFYSRQAQAGQEAQPAQDAAQNSNVFTGAVDMVTSAVSNFSSRPVDVVNDTMVRAFLSLIRVGEGTGDAGGYSRLFGGRQFDSYADHPRVPVAFGNTYSTAAGAYQILARTWDEIAAQYSLLDFSPASQDLAAVALIKRRGALGDVLAGRYASAIEKCNKEWASLPGSPYGQPTLTLGRASTILAALGVQSTEILA